MFLNKTVLVTALALFVTTGCVSIGTEGQQEQITNLQGKLAASDKTKQKTQNELVVANTALKASQTKISKLDTLLTKAIKENTAALRHKKNIVQFDDKENIVQFDDKTVLGRIEWVYISKAKSNYTGRIDTGSATSSLHAINLKHFERDGRKWVRFNLSHADGKAPELIEAKITGMKKITQPGKTGGTNEYPVVRLQVRIGNALHRTAFTLTDGKSMEYPVLLGRSFLRDVILVDVGQEYIHPKYKKSVKK